MAKSNSFNKREVEKRKQEKRQVKQQKKEERKGETGRTFDEMIAYVDQNGVITSTPPSIDSKKNINLEDIHISVPKKSHADDNLPLSGRVEYFDEVKGFGFIKDKNSVNKYFFHKSNAPRGIKENNMVFFELERGQKGMNAINIRLEGAAETPPAPLPEQP
jgi:cold shock CspA family protein